jgi:thiol-disulfide isomerase/thioredoxin
MKKIILTLISMVAGGSLMAQMSSVQGVIEPGSVRYTNIELMRIEHGAPVSIAKTDIAADGSYGFLFTPSYEGFYAVGAPSLMDGQFDFYIKKGENIQMNITGIQSELLGSLSEENQQLQQWNTLSNEIKGKAVYFNKVRSTYVDFFPAMENADKIVTDFQKQVNTKNVAFNALMKDYARMSMDFYALNFLSTPRTAHPDASVQRPAIYSTLVQKDKFASNNVMKYLYGDRFVGMYIGYIARQHDIKDDEVLLPYLSTNEQKAAYLIKGRLPMIKTYDQFTAFTEKNAQYFDVPTQKVVLEDLGAKLYQSKAGEEASDFTYPDANGKQISLSDYKGKVVLVDVWATWCGPCKAQFPALRELEEAVKGKDIVIISVSVDEAKDKEKWKQMIKDERLGGVQLFAGGWNSKITKDYKIKGIPRFMVFNKEGKVVTSDAPRPSDPELKKMLEAELKK